MILLPYRASIVIVTGDAFEFHSKNVLNRADHVDRYAVAC